ncbi:hypothetical protein ACLB1E_02370 [Escherichia coli]
MLFENGVPRSHGRHAKCIYKNPYIAAKIRPKTHDTLTPINPGRIKTMSHDEATDVGGAGTVKLNRCQSLG